MRFGLAAIVVMTISASAGAATWAEGLPPDAVSRYLRAGDKTVLVAAAGAPSAERDEAARAVVEALRSGKRAEVVMTAEALGVLTDLDDAAIVAKAAYLPLDLVAIVRTFPGAGDRPASATVALFARSGEPVGSFAATKGGLPSEGARLAVAQPAAKAAVPAVATASLPAHDDEYEQRFVWFDEWVGFNAQGSPVANWTNAYRGKYRVPLQGARFYEEIDRPDLAEQYRAKQWLKTGIATGGILTLAAGAGTILYNISADCTGDAVQCSQTRQDRALLGGGISLLGAALLSGAALIDSHPVDASEARRLADEHNRKLKRASSTTASGLPASFAPRIGFIVGDKSGGLLLDSRF